MAVNAIRVTSQQLQAFDLSSLPNAIPTQYRCDGRWVPDIKIATEFVTDAYGDGRFLLAAVSGGNPTGLLFCRDLGGQEVDVHGIALIPTQAQASIIALAALLVNEGFVRVYGWVKNARVRRDLLAFLPGAHEDAATHIIVELV